jgi:hypothetical protein
MASLNYDDAELFKVGDLVEFIGYNYTPDYYVHDDEYANMLGIVVEEVVMTSMYITSSTWMYRVYWFKTKKITDIVAGHLKLVYNSRSARGE